MIGRRSPRPLRPARRLTTIGATIAMAMTLPVAAGAPMASAEPRPDLAELTPMIAANGSKNLNDMYLLFSKTILICTFLYPMVISKTWLRI